MNTIPETQLLAIASVFDETTKREYTYKGYRIVIAEYDGDFEYEIFEGDPVYWDHGFESEEAAKQAAKEYLDNYDSNDQDYAQ